MCVYKVVKAILIERRTNYNHGKRYFSTAKTTISKSVQSLLANPHVPYGHGMFFCSDLDNLHVCINGLRFA